MRFKTNLSRNKAHSSAATCVGWGSAEEVYSIGDDNRLLSWTVSNYQAIKVMEFDNDLCAIDMHFFPRVSTMKKQGDLILVTSTDGKFHIVTHNGRIERSVEAHQGAVLVGQWSHDGTGLLTAGEDGYIKVWSRSGMLRSTVVCSDSSVYGACWSPDCQTICYLHGKCIVLKQLAPNTKPLRWKGSDSLLLCLAWSSTSELIVSGGEDCRYRVWDSQGRPIFSSTLHDHPITTAAWSPEGELFAVGSYNTLRLCDSLGWSRSLDKPQTNCIYKLAWSKDGTQVAGACANGYILFCHVIERQACYKNYLAKVTEKRTITIEDMSNETKENLEFPARVIQMMLRYSYLVVTTPSQCYIYNVNNWNTPTIFDIKERSLILLMLCDRYMSLVERANIGLYNYEGRLIGSPRWPNMKLNGLRSSHISISPDTLVVRDFSDLRLMHVVDVSSNKNVCNELVMIQHTSPILKVALNQSGSAVCRNIAILDKNKNLYICSVWATDRKFSKLGTQIQSFAWNAEVNMLAAIQDAHVLVWYCPTACFNMSLLRMSSFQFDSPELGQSLVIDNFVGNIVSARRGDGSLIHIPILPYIAFVHRYVLDNKWDEALRLCRSMNEESLWACLSVFVIHSNRGLLEMAEECFAMLGQYDKVVYIQHLKKLPIKVEQMAGMVLLAGSLQTSDSILLHNGLIYQAIQNNVKLHQWNRALDLALKHKTHVDMVLLLRQQYLAMLGKGEYSGKFLETQGKFITAREKMGY